MGGGGTTRSGKGVDIDGSMHLVRMKDRGSRGRWHNGARSGEGVKGLQEDESLPGSDERGLGIVDGQVCRGTTSFVRYGFFCPAFVPRSSFSPRL